ncbi:unnamed protein product [Thlaspi arvense]|uniref:Nucleoplasmin-like domain-containing protein n=1 Tax=Thlaspi arvense TaxID=13288 RepID=A0AAU9SWU7_THLAR|nr:unnamed protein product [Thlaspi arvense]
MQLTRVFFFLFVMHLGAEVKAGKPLTLKPDQDCLIHVSQASLDEGKRGESALLYVTVDGKKLVIGTLSQGNIPQISFDLVFEKEFELSHSLERGSVQFRWLQIPQHRPISFYLSAYFSVWVFVLY